MENEQFSEEIDSLVDRGASTYYEYEIGIEAFHHLRKIQRQFRFFRILNIALASTVLLLFIALAAAVITKKGSPGVAGDEKNKEGLSTAVVDTIEKIKSENRMLREKNTSLEKEIKAIRKQFLARGEAGASDYQGGTDYDRENSGVDSVIYHEVRKGETLYSIAEKYYGDGQMYIKIMSANNLSRQSDIYEGRQLKIYSRSKIK